VWRQLFGFFRTSGSVSIASVKQPHNRIKDIFHVDALFKSKPQQRTCTSTIMMTMTTTTKNVLAVVVAVCAVVPPVTTAFGLTSSQRPSLVQRRLSKKEDLQELYRAVAEQDPEWFHEFVTNVLQEPPSEEPTTAIVMNGDDIAQELLDTVSSAVVLEDQQQQQKQEQQEEIFQLLQENEKDPEPQPVQQQQQQEAQHLNIPVQQQDIRSSTNDSNNTTDRVVVYRNLYTAQRCTVPLYILVDLGYHPDKDVPWLQPDVLSLIVEDQIPKPRVGIPPQWKVTRSQQALGDVQIVSSIEAQQLVKDTVSSAREYGSEPRTRRTVTRHAPVTTRPTVSQSTSRPTPTRGADPPPPIHPAWMDLETFRDLLRREAQWRFQLLGRDWKDPLRKESKWRLQLYKEWLWSLSEGVGGEDLVVPTRLPPRNNTETPGKTRNILDPRNPPRRKSRRTTTQEALPMTAQQQRSAKRQARQNQRRGMEEDADEYYYS
jgi:hypothetical protein